MERPGNPSHATRRRGSQHRGGEGVGEQAGSNSWPACQGVRLCPWVGSPAMAAPRLPQSILLSPKQAPMWCNVLLAAAEGYKRRCSKLARIASSGWKCLAYRLESVSVDPQAEPASGSRGTERSREEPEQGWAKEFCAQGGRPSAPPHYAAVFF